MKCYLAANGTLLVRSESLKDRAKTMQTLGILFSMEFLLPFEISLLNFWIWIFLYWIRCLGNGHSLLIFICFTIKYLLKNLSYFFYRIRINRLAGDRSSWLAVTEMAKKPTPLKNTHFKTYNGAWASGFTTTLFLNKGVEKCGKNMF